MTEVHRFSEKILNHGGMLVNLGLRRAMRPRVKLLASVGTGLTNSPETPTFIAYFGVQVAVGEK
jgi:hypothetical protein